MKEPTIQGWTLRAVVEFLGIDGELRRGAVEDILQGFGTKHVGGARRRIVLRVCWTDWERNQAYYAYREPSAILRRLPDGEAEKFRKEQADRAVRATWENDPTVKLYEARAAAESKLIQ